MLSKVLHYNIPQSKIRIILLYLFLGSNIRLDIYKQSCLIIYYV